jgi:hypothetical protein
MKKKIGGYQLIKKFMQLLKILPTDTIRLHRYYVGLDMCREWKEIEFPKEYCIWIWKEQYWEGDQEIDDKMKWGRMEE